MGLNQGTATRSWVSATESHERHLGTRIATRFLSLGAKFDVTELRGHTARPARFKK